MKTSAMVRLTTAAVVLACWASLAVAGPLGELEIQGDVRLTQLGSSQTMTLRNTTFSLFSGDRIVTGDSSASLRLGSGDSLAVGPHSELSLTANGSYLQADLTRGSLAYLFRSNGTALRINGEEAVPSSQLRMVQIEDSGRLTSLEGQDAQRLAERSGLTVSDSGVSATCKDPSLCENSRPRSLSP